MEKKDIAKILDEIRQNRTICEKLREKSTPDSIDEAGEMWASAAAELGYDVTGEEIRDYILEAEEAAKQKTREAGDEIRSVPEEDLGEAAGGGDHSDCQDTYKSRENCWHNDGCDAFYHHYRLYKCHYIMA